MLSVRPKVAELVFQLYGRSLHPELFVVHQTQKVARGDYEAKIDITSDGHLVTWKYGDFLLSEVTTSALHPLPERRRHFSARLRGSRHERMECREGVVYEVDFQLESVEPEVIWTFQQELADGAEQGLGQGGLLHRFDSSGRIAMGAMSFINVESRDRSLFVQAFHTFPDDYAIVRSQSRFTILR